MSANWAVNMKVLRLTADTNAIVTHDGYYFGIRAVTDGTNVMGVEVFDSLTGTGTYLDTIVGAAGGVKSYGTIFPHGIRFDTGLSVNVTTPGSVTIWYIPT